MKRKQGKKKTRRKNETKRDKMWMQRRRKRMPEEGCPEGGSLKGREAKRNKRLTAKGGILQRRRGKRGGIALFQGFLGRE